MQILRFGMSALLCALIPLTLNAMELGTASSGQQSDQLHPIADQPKRALGASLENFSMTEELRKNDAARAEGTSHEALNSLKTDSEAMEKSSSWLQTIKKYFHAKPLLLDLASLFADENDDDEAESKIDARKLLNLCLHARTDAVLELLACDPAVVKEHLNLVQLKKYFKLCAEEASTAAPKCSALKKSFKSSLWNNYFHCKELKLAVDHIVDLFYLTYTDEEKTAKLTGLKELLTSIKKIVDTQTDDQPLKKFTNIDAMLTTVEEAIEKKQLNPIQLARALNGKPLIALLPQKTALLRDACSPDNLLNLVATALLLDKPSEKLTFFELISCFRMDELICTLPKLVGGNERSLSLWFNVPQLRKVLQEFQKGTALTGNDLKKSISKELLQEFGITIDTVAEWLDFENIATQLNKWRRGEKISQEDLSKGGEALKELSQALGVDLVNATNTSLPSELQQKKIEKVVELATDPTWCMRLAYGLPLVGLTYAAHYAGHALCHPCMEFFEPTRWWTAGPLAILWLGAALKGSEVCEKFFANPPILKRVLVNSAMSMGITKLMRVGNTLWRTTTSAETLCKEVPEGHQLELPFKEFCRLLQNEHLQKLADHYSLLQLLDPSMNFATNKAHEEFLLGLFTVAPENTQERIAALINLLKAGKNPTSLPHYQQYTIFKNFLAVGNREATRELPHTAMLELALYNPRLLFTQLGFIRKLYSVNVANKSLFLQLMSAVEKAEGK